LSLKAFENKASNNWSALRFDLLYPKDKIKISRAMISLSISTARYTTSSRIKYATFNGVKKKTPKALLANEAHASPFPVLYSKVLLSIRIVTNGAYDTKYGVIIDNIVRPAQAT